MNLSKNLDLSKSIAKIEGFFTPKYMRIFGWIGIFVATTKLLKLACSLRRLFWFQKDLPSRYGKGSWALITGGANGIGKAFSLEFAKLGFNILALDIDSTSLDNLKKEITTLYPSVKVEGLTVDFTKVVEEHFFEAIEKVIAGRDISILVNNVGLGLTGPIDQLVYPKRET